MGTRWPRLFNPQSEIRNRKGGCMNLVEDQPRLCIETELPEFPLVRRGKVRDVYEVDGKLLMIATDRISAFDVVLPTPIPMKGAVLTQISRFWFDMLRDLVPNHMVSVNVDEFPDRLKKYRLLLRLRSTLALKVEMFPVECVARGYLSGSGWTEYRETGSICGIQLPPGLRDSHPLPEPIFTPATKAESGHDMNISFEEVVKIVGRETAERLRQLTLEIYGRAADYAIHKGIIIADTKLEFGLYDGRIILCDEVLTPDSSRFWPRAHYRPGRPQPSFDKQFVRDYLESINFNKQPPGPPLPEAVVKQTSEKYLDAYLFLTGSPLA
jgi:phosphoribosylaminoimidazole-succinocarboxamide synthase